MKLHGESEQAIIWSVGSEHGEGRGDISTPNRGYLHHLRLDGPPQVVEESQMRSMPQTGE